MSCLVDDRDLARMGTVASDWHRHSYRSYYWGVLDGLYALKGGFYIPTPCPPLHLLVWPSDFRGRGRTGIRMPTEMQPTQKHVAWHFSKELSLTYVIKWEDTLICSSLVPRTIRYKTEDGGTWCVGKIAASATRFWPENNRKETSSG